MRAASTRWRPPQCATPMCWDRVLLPTQLRASVKRSALPLRLDASTLSRRRSSYATTLNRPRTTISPPSSIRYALAPSATCYVARSRLLVPAPTWLRCVRHVRAYSDSSPGSPDSNKKTDAPPEAIDTTSSTRLLTIPNLLTLSRMVISPVIGYWIVEGEYVLATTWFLAASATDAVDGYIAKRFNQKSVLGSFLDPLADKLMMTIMVSTMAYKALLPLPLVGLILLRDVSLLAGGAIRRIRSLPKPITISKFFSVSSVESIEIKPSTISKVNTVLQVGLVFIVLSANACDYTLNSIFLSGLEWSVAATTLISGLDYLNSNAMQRIKILQNRIKPK